MDILNQLKRIGMFLIYAHIILNFCPDEKYIRYIRVILGIIVILQVLKPVLPIIKAIYS